MPLKVNLCAILASAALLQPQSANAQDSEWYAEATAGVYVSENDDATTPSFDIFVQKSVDDDTSLFAFGYVDRDFNAIYVGAAQSFGDLELGLGAGHARYDDQSWFVIHPWAYWERGAYSAYGYFEYIPADEFAPFFYRIDVRRQFGQDLFAGAYAEKFFGVGPVVGANLSETVAISAAVPIVDLPDEDRTLVLVQLTASF